MIGECNSLPKLLSDWWVRLTAWLSLTPLLCDWWVLLTACTWPGLSQASPHTPSGWLHWGWSDGPHTLHCLTHGQRAAPVRHTQTLRHMGRTCETDTETHGQRAAPVRQKHLCNGQEMWDTDSETHGQKAAHVRYKHWDTWAVSRTCETQWDTWSVSRTCEAQTVRHGQWAALMRHSHQHTWAAPVRHIDWDTPAGHLRHKHEDTWAGSVRHRQ